MQTESAARSIALEMQSRYLHPAWLKAQKAEGYAGALQVLKAVQFAWGWQAVAPETVRPDHWQSLYDTLVRDKQNLGLPQWLNQNKQAYAQALERMVQAERLGYWKPNAATRSELATTYQALTRDAPLHQELTAVRQWSAAQLQQAVATPAAATTLQPKQATALKPAEPVTPTQRDLLLQVQEQEQPPAPKLRPSTTERISQALTWVVMALLMSFGALWQLKARREFLKP